MKIVVYIILILSISVSSCKRKRKINVEGTVTDIYTGMPAANVDVYLYSQIVKSPGGGEVKTYQQTTDGSGHFYFKDAFFSKPANEGWVVIKDDEYQDIDGSSGAHSIMGSDIKFIGKTNLTKNIQVICTSTLQLVLIRSPLIDVQYATFYRKFSGSGYVPQSYLDFNEFGYWRKVPSQGYDLPNKLIGYSDGKNIIKTEYFDNNTQTTKTQYDTIISQGCGSVNNYTITLN